MLQATCRVFGLSKAHLCRSLPGVSAYNVRLTACDCTGIKEAPILDNEAFLASPEEARMRNNLESTIMVPTMVDLTPISGFPEEFLRTRRVRIYQPPKNAMQSGTNNIRHWELEFDTQQRWENALMGWTSTGDPLSNLKMKFPSPQEAIDHCDKNGWMWYIDVPKTDREFKPKAYATNFSWNRRSRISTK
ncbi:NADH dehydrogenase [ubiquinone] iron-sulfur protein 4, mitochondrial-like [Ostrinia nubilalis]|uniref:NADH dehydrogenase [ubiquinone] iron-sulfur protein 4, mitochondrial-like n=1 Tax=Ostrinia furnacalis TaxID=93504 RepID=UPI00103A136F|nr:NADH dehydrogenase [ubiquinone] iron-sulfur protein 4, mitochondrial-like [Ostrinia furnacalis]